MIPWLLQYLEKAFLMHIPAVFNYTSTRVIMAACTALALVLIFGGQFIKKLYELKIGQPIREDTGFLLGELHKNKKNTPTMGGALILFALMSSMLLWMNLAHPFTWILFITLVVLGFLGGYDDYLKLKYKNSKGLSARKKLIVQFAVAFAVIAYLQLPQITALCKLSTPIVKDVAHAGQELSLQEYTARLYVPFFKEPVVIFSGLGLVVLWIFLSFVIVGSSNAANLTDGLDGLASGLLIFVTVALGAIAFLSNNLEFASYLNLLYIEGAGEIAIFMAAMCGSLLGFLWYNSHPAQVFMGDIGSLALGGAIGVAAVLLRREFFLGIVGAIFVAEALSVILQVTSFRYFNKKRIFRCAPLHHHFEYLGWPETKVVIRFWIIGFLLCLIGLGSIKFQ
ncbi:MAG TPA: phospho-N-acetylmuramoyl-pentapeptide-transferase [Chlamydiales bacterium]|nr:phospho-N-acetylmuramoyl-pentapeptide-transferase [Chlamydiales bacterium]